MPGEQSYPVLNFLKRLGARKFNTSYSIDKFEELLRTRDESFWQIQGEKKALNLFRAVNERVPAYRDFLKKNGVRPSSIKTIKDFSKIPITTKKNYIQKYSTADLSWDGKLENSSIMAVSSGTTGKPTLWPRSFANEQEANILHELMYKYIFHCHKKNTLMVICFPMGIYISGIATLLPSIHIAQKNNYNLTVISAGTRKEDALRVIKEEINNYEQVVLIGHPYFVKDVLESGRLLRIPWSKKKIRLMFCSEGFNEDWRDYMIRLMGNMTTQYDTMSTLGSSEMLLMANETPFSIFVRRLANNNLNLHNKIFKTNYLPNLFQYNPLMRFIESVKNDLVYTSDSGIPLVRYDIKDTGKVISIKEIISQLDLIEENWKIRFKSETAFKIWNLPFVTLENRSDNTIVFYAANIYPENIREGLNHKPFLSKITGKFTMVKRATHKMEQKLEVHIELKEGVKKSIKLKKQIETQLFKVLIKENLEYKYIVQNYKNKQRNLHPNVVLWNYQNDKYFKQGLKPRYIINS